MKKSLLFICLAIASLSASAQNAVIRRLDVPKDENIILDPTGTEEPYIMSYTDNNGFGETDYTNGKVTVRRSADGNTYYFNGLTPGGNRSYKGAPESWLKGEKDGNSIVIKAGQKLVENQAKTLYLEIVHADSNGTITSFEDEARLTVGADGELKASDDDIFAIYEDAETEDEAGFFGFFYKLDLKPMGELVRFSFPEGVTPDTYVLSGKDAYGSSTMRLAKVAFDGARFFVSGLSSKSPDEVYEGTISGNYATIPSFQIIKDADLFYYRLVPVTIDEDYNSTVLKNIDFLLSDDRHTLTLSPADAYLCETSYDLSSYASTAKNLTLKYYAGDHAAKPAAPQVGYWDDSNDALVFVVPTCDVDGEYVNPDKLAYRIYADGELYTFTKADYERIENDMTELPWNYTDNFDIVSNGQQKVVYFHNLSAKKIGIESVYTVDGVATVSDRIVYDIETSTGISDNAAGLQPVGVAYYSMEGTRINSPKKGSIVLKQSVMADGSKRVEKILVK